MNLFVPALPVRLCRLRHVLAYIVAPRPSPPCRARLLRFTPRGATLPSPRRSVQLRSTRLLGPGCLFGSCSWSSMVSTADDGCPSAPHDARGEPPPRPAVHRPTDDQQATGHQIQLDNRQTVHAQLHSVLRCRATYCATHRCMSCPSDVA